MAVDANKRPEIEVSGKVAFAAEKAAEKFTDQSDDETKGGIRKGSAEQKKAKNPSQRAEHLQEKLLFQNSSMIERLQSKLDSHSKSLEKLRPQCSRQQAEIRAMRGASVLSTLFITLGGVSMSMSSSPDYSTYQSRMIDGGAAFVIAGVAVMLFATFMPKKSE